MIKGKDIYEVFAGLVPLYVPMVLAYSSVRWWKILTPEQCSGINRYVALFAVPLLSFRFISITDPYNMNFKFLAADTLQKIVILGALILWGTFTKRGSLDWTITLFSLTTLPNALLVGVPLLTAMYGEFSANLLIQIVVLQSVIWYPFLLLLYEYRGAKKLISQQFPETAGSISSLRVDSDVSSLSGREPLEVNEEIGKNGKLEVIVRSSASSSMVPPFNKSLSTPRESYLNGVEIYSAHSYRKLEQKASSFNQTNLYTNGMHKKIFRSKSCTDEFFNRRLVSPYPSLKSKLSRSINGGQRKSDISFNGGVADGNRRHGLNTIAPDDFGTTIPSKVIDVPQEIVGIKDVYPKASEDREHEIKEETTNKKQQMPPTSVMTRLILIMVWRSLMRNPNTYAAILGLAWSLISFRWNIKMPSIISGSITILSNTGLGMAMFSLGLFTASQPKIIACGKTWAAISMAIKFLVGPAVIAATSAAIGIRGVLLRVEIVQAAIPQGIVPFVFAKEYNLHPDIISTSVIFGMAIALPITLLYYVLLGL